MAPVSPPLFCHECHDTREKRVRGGMRREPCPACAVTCPECEGIGCLRGEEGPDPCPVCAGVGLAKIKQ